MADEKQTVEELKADVADLQSRYDEMVKAGGDGRSALASLGGQLHAAKVRLADAVMAEA